jgi:hypothetical protein
VIKRFWRWLTPDDAPDGTRTIALTIPKGDEWEAIVRGALVPLMFPSSYELFGAITPEEAATAFQEAFQETFQWTDCP